MKKTIILTVAAISTIFVSCTGGGSASFKTQTDTIAYAMGVLSATSAKSVDSTVNVDNIIAGIRDVFANSPKMTPEQANAQLQLFFQAQQEKMYKEYLEKMSKDSLANAEEATKFFSEKEKEAGIKKSESGLLYTITSEGAANKVNVGDSVTVNFTLKNLKGETLQTSIGSAPLKSINEKQYLLPGFVEGLTLVGKGGKVTLYIPASLGYGARGNNLVGPEQGLIFDIEVLDAKKIK